MKFRVLSRLQTGIFPLPTLALDLHFSRALVAGRVPLPPPGLSPRADSRCPSPPPSRATLNELRPFPWILRRDSELRGDKKCAFFETARFYFFLLLFSSLQAIKLFLATISACRLAFDISSSLGLAVDYLPGRVAFGLDPLRISSLGYEYGTTAQAAALVIFVQHKTRGFTFILVGES